MARSQPSFLRQFNERQVFSAVQTQGPLSRADIARHTGISGPTVTRAVASLLDAALVEEEEPRQLTVGRPGKLIRLARNGVNLLTGVIGTKQCEFRICGLDGTSELSESLFCTTPPTYHELVTLCEHAAYQLMAVRPGRTLRFGLSLPGLLESHEGRSLFSPNLHQLNGQCIGRDLEERLDLPVTLLQECHALCLAEQAYGDARGIEHFAMLDINEGLGLGVVQEGRLLLGCSGLAGELGHITINVNGLPCGCGNRGCLETVATDTALARAISHRLGQTLTIDELVTLSQKGTLNIQPEVENWLEYLGVAVAAAINIFNPSYLFIHGRGFDLSPNLWPQLEAVIRRRALSPSLAACRLVRARGQKRLGVLAGTLRETFYAPEQLEFQRFRQNSGIINDAKPSDHTRC